MYRRIDVLRRCKQGRISKHAHNGRDSKSMQRKIADAGRLRSSGQWTWQDSFEGPADAFRRYNSSNEQLSVAVDSFLVDSRPVISDRVMLDGSVLQSSHISQHMSTEELLEHSAIAVQETGRRSSSLRSLQRHFAGRRPPNYLKRVFSVIQYSSSNSWRSSMISLSSITSSAQQIRTSLDQMWDEFIDEEKLAQPQGKRPKYVTTSLHNRTCCVTTLEAQSLPASFLPSNSKSCELCGLTDDHCRALQISSFPGTIPGGVKPLGFTATQHFIVWQPPPLTRTSFGR
jgi:hypothetical protein